MSLKMELKAIANYKELVFCVVPPSAELALSAL